MVLPDYDFSDSGISNETGKATITTQHDPPENLSDSSTTDRKSPSSSNHISIVSLEDGDSSIADSDSDFDDMPSAVSDFMYDSANGAKVNSSSNGIIVVNDSNAGTQNGNVAGKPNIGSIAVQNSSDITFGNKTFYQGPVTIKQFLLENNKWRPRQGTDNAAYESGSADVEQPTTGIYYESLLLFIIGFLHSFIPSIIK